MKSEGAVRMWHRSEEKGYRCHFLVIETSLFKAVCNMNNGNGPYASHSVVKEECINHVQKQIVTLL